MKKGIVIAVSIIVILIVIGVVLNIHITHTPEYALRKIANDIEESGIDGLMPHLTDDARDTVATITSISKNEMVNSILSFLGKGDYASVLKSNLKEVEWTLDDILEGDARTAVVLGFNYKEKLIGTIEINMIKENGDWKIGGLELPKFTEINFEN